MPTSQDYLDLLEIGYVVVNEEGLILETNRSFSIFFPSEMMQNINEVGFYFFDQTDFLNRILNSTLKKFKQKSKNNQVFQIQSFEINDAVYQGKNIITFQDITQEEILLEKLIRESEIDHLTGAYNRRRFEKEFLQLLEHCKRTGDSGALILFDIDSFKAINDQWGHFKGDEVLKRIGNLISPIIRKYELFARIGGDEFAILIGHSAPQAIQRILKQMQELMTQIKLKNCNTEHKLSISTGYAFFQDADWNKENIYAMADLNLYHNKKLKNIL